MTARKTDKKAVEQDQQQALGQPQAAPFVASVGQLSEDAAKTEKPAPKSKD